MWFQTRRFFLSFPYISLCKLLKIKSFTHVLVSLFISVPHLALDSLLILRYGSRLLCQKKDQGVITLFSCSTQLSMKLKLLIKTKNLINNDFSCCQTLCWCINLLINDKMPKIVGILTFMSRISFVRS